jgi:putative FmdB family regulatory protein
MPVYDYKCACGHTFECRQDFSSEPFARCSECGAMAHRQLHCTPIIFKGSGFYITDHRKESGDEKPKRVKTEDTESKSDSSGETKTETSTATKTESKSESKREKTGREPAKKE